MAFMAVPGGQLLWQNLSWSFIQRSLKDHPQIDLGNVDGWKPSESFRLNLTVLRLAFRHGVACSRGIVFDEWLFNVEDRPQLLQRSQADLSASRAALPGWAQHPELDAADEERTQDSIAKARAELDKLLAAPVKPELEERWRSLGGVLPEPL